jgi:hypothetical protein
VSDIDSSFNNTKEFNNALDLTRDELVRQRQGSVEGEIEHMEPL